MHKAIKTSNKCEPALTDIEKNEIDSSSKDYFITEILKNFNTAKESMDSALKEFRNNLSLLDSPNDISIMHTTSNSFHMISKTNGHQHTNSVTSNPGLSPNVDLKSDFQFRQFVNSLVKENTCLKLELKMLYDCLKQNSQIIEMNEATRERKISDNNSMEFQHKSNSNNASNQPLSSTMIKQAYFLKMKDENQKDQFLLEIKKFINTLRSSDFFIC